MLTDGHSIHENCQPLLLTIPKDQVLNIQQLPKCLPTLALLNPLSGLLK